MYSINTLIDLLNSLANYEIHDGCTHEEVIDKFISCGATISLLNDIGFNDDDIDDYIYYLSSVTGEPEESIRRKLS